MIFISGLLHCFTQLSSFILLAIPEMLRYAGALRLDNRKFFRCPGRKVSLGFFFVLWISTTLDCWNACFYPRRRWPRLVCVGACIIASSVLKLRKCFTLFYVWACHVLWALRLKSIKLSNCQTVLNKVVRCDYCRTYEVVITAEH